MACRIKEGPVTPPQPADAAIRHADAVFNIIHRFLVGQRCKEVPDSCCILGIYFRPEPAPDDLIPAFSEILVVGIIDKDMGSIGFEEADELGLILHHHLVLEPALPQFLFGPFSPGNITDDPGNSRRGTVCIEDAVCGQ